MNLKLKMSMDILAAIKKCFISVITRPSQNIMNIKMYYKKHIKVIINIKMHHRITNV